MKAFSKILGITMLSIILVGFGAALAMWSETLRINVYINTGEVKVKWSNWSCSDVGIDPQAPGFNNTEEKDVAKCIVKPELYDAEGNPIKMNITLDNVYPGYAVNITLIVDNIGTIPVKLLSYSWTNLSAQDEEALNISLIIPNNTQIDPPNGTGVYILEIIVTQQANETATYHFDLELTFAQWNEVP
ncbi:hypothetical protein J4526_06765 [Desulfurococcaceae archaeon MEX13E-LK6-19]|nr:hypothetical protein J4526_06765 [Desulfurococcaceae archaeon MEX13E-LK6-19]